MSNPFFKAMNLANEVASEIFGEPFSVAGVTYQAIDLGDADHGERAMPGGRYKPGSIKITVDRREAARADLKANTLLEARGQQFRVDTITNEGDDALVFVCGPASIQNPRLK